MWYVTWSDFRKGDFHYKEFELFEDALKFFQERWRMYPAVDVKLCAPGCIIAPCQEVQP